MRTTVFQTEKRTWHAQTTPLESSPREEAFRHQEKKEIPEGPLLGYVN